MAVDSPFHQLAVLLVSIRSGDAEKSKSRVGVVSGTHGLLANGRDTGGVNKAEMTALDVLAELKLRSIFPAWSFLFGSSIDEEAEVVDW